MNVERQTVAVTTDASGDATVYSEPVNGLLSSIAYVKTDFADGVDFTITEQETGRTLWTESDVNASATRAPRQATHSELGVASLYAAAGLAVQDRIAVSGRIKIVVANGGDTKTGSFIVTTY